MALTETLKQAGEWLAHRLDKAYKIVLSGLVPAIAMETQHSANLRQVNV